MAILMADYSERDANWFDTRKWWPQNTSTSQVVAEAGLTTVISGGGQGLHANLRTRPTLDGELHVKGFNRSSLTNTLRARFSLRWDQNFAGTGNENPNTALYVRIDNTGDVNLAKTVNNVASNLIASSSVLMPNADTDYDMRFRSQGGRIQVRVWPSASAEPSTWDYDVADDGTVPAGVPGMHSYRNGSGAAFFSYQEIIYSVSPLVPRLSPLIFRNRDGSKMPYGKVSSLLTDDAIQGRAIPSWITGGAALTDDAANLRRKLQAAANASASLTLPQIVTPAGSVVAEAIWLRVRSMLEDTDANTGVRLQLVGPTNTFGLIQDAAQTQARIQYGAGGGSFKVLSYQMHSGGEGTRRRSVSLLLLPRLKQVIAFEEDIVIGWVDLAAVVTESLTPTLQVTSTTTAAKNLYYKQLEVEVQQF